MMEAAVGNPGERDMMQCAGATWHPSTAFLPGSPYLDEQDRFSPESVDELSGEKDSCGDGASRPTRVLVVDDERLIADTLASILNLSGFVAGAVYSGEAALEALPTLCPDIVLTDIRMPGRDGIETGVMIREQCPHTRVVLFSGQAGTSDVMDKAREHGHAFELWPKPIHPTELVRRLREL